MISFLDVIFGAIALFFLIRGLFRGLLKEVLSTIGVVGAWWLGSRYGSEVAPYLQDWIESPGLAEFAGYILVFFAVMTGVKILTWGIAKVLDASPSAWLDKPAGMLIGFAKAWLLCCVVLAGLLAFMPDAEFIKNAQSTPYLRPGAEYLQEKMPQGMDGFEPAKMLPASLPAFPGMGNNDSDQSSEQSADEQGMTGKAQELLKKIGDSIKDLKKDEPAQ